MRDLLLTLHYLMMGLSAGFTVTYIGYAVTYVAQPTPEHPLQLTWLLTGGLISITLGIATQRTCSRLN